jgi:hypothetical protein
MTDKGFSPDKFIDREAEQELFNELLKFQDARLLTICDAGGRGKSSLLKQLRYKCGWQHDPPLLASLVHLDQLSDHTPFSLIAEIKSELTKFADTFGLESHFTMFDELDEARSSGNFEPFRNRTPTGQTEGRIDARGANIRGGVQSGTIGTVIYQHIEHAQSVSAGSTEDWSATKEDIARRECVKAFFEDLKHICATQPIVVLLDSWERSNEDLQEWIVNRIVRPLCFDTDNRPDKFSLVLAGRKLPDFKQLLRDEFRHNKLVKSIESLGAWEEEHVKAFLQAYGYEDLSEEEFTVSLICSRLKSGWSLINALEVAKNLRAG